MNNCSYKTKNILTAVLAIGTILLSILVIKTNTLDYSDKYSNTQSPVYHEKTKMEIQNYEVTVNHNQTLNQMIASANFTGKNDFVSEMVEPKNIKLSGGKGEEKVQITLIKLEKAMNENSIPAYLKEKGYRGATIEELLALSSKYPDLQRKNFITNFSPIKVGAYKFITALTGDSDYRALDMFTAHGWWENMTVLAVVKIKQ
jgi:hypothetical protein